MPLTRHFYESEEVMASLLYTISKGVVKESVFWCYELVHSGYATEAISILFESWVWHYGVFAMGRFLQMMDRLGQSEVSSTDLFEEIYQLCHAPIRDHSVWNLLSRLYYQSSDGWDRVTFRSPSQFPSREPKEIYLIRAIYQHKTKAAWWISSWISTERYLQLLEWYREHLIEEQARDEILRFFQAIESYERLLGYSHDGYQRVSHLLMLMSLCLTPSQRQRSLQTTAIRLDLLHEWIDQWSQHQGRRSGRFYSIPYYALYGTWGRGRMLQSNNTIKQLGEIEKQMLACPFWEEAVGGKPWVEWETYFPDDLPDEWTRSEKEKSHGSGLLRANEKVTLWGYTKRYMIGRSYLVWNGGQWNQPDRIQFFEEKEIDPSHSPFQALLSYAFPSSFNQEEPSIDRLQPKHKRYRILG